MRLCFTPLVVSDLEDILNYIAQQRPLTAVEVIRRRREKCEKLAAHPGMGQSRPEFPGDYRSVPIERWIIFDRVLEHTVEVHRILDGARDIDSLMGND